MTHSVAVYANEVYNEFAITVRDFNKSPHWQRTFHENFDYQKDMCVYVDTRDKVYKPFTLMAEFMLESDARKFAAVIEAAYAIAGYKRVTIKSKEQV